MREKLNILFLGGAKRVSMARMFIEAGKARNLDVNIYSYELSHHVPIAAVGTVITGLRWNDPEIYNDIHRVVTEYHIDVMIPFIDMMVGVSSRYAERYNDVFVPVSPQGLCDIMFDKVLSAEIFERCNLPIPATYLKGKPVFPLIAKPRTGSASKGIRILRNVVDFRQAIAPPARYLIQEYIEEREEYTVDCYVTAAGVITCISPRIRLEVVGGEVSHTVTVDDPDIVSVTTDTIHRTGLRGAVTVQFMRDKATRRLLVMEVNPRLGGGAVCSVHAGADIPGMIIDEAQGNAVAEATNIAPGTEIVRYFQEVVFKK